MTESSFLSLEKVKEFEVCFDHKFNTAESWSDGVMRMIVARAGIAKIRDDLPDEIRDISVKAYVGLLKLVVERSDYEVSFDYDQDELIYAFQQWLGERSKIISKEDIWKAQSLLQVFTIGQLVRLAQLNSCLAEGLYDYLWEGEGSPPPVRFLFNEINMYTIFRPFINKDKRQILKAYGLNGVLSLPDASDDVIGSLRTDGWNISSLK